MLIVPSALKDVFVDLSTKADELVKAVCPYIYESKLLYSYKIKNSRHTVNETKLIKENINQYRLRIMTQN